MIAKHLLRSIAKDKRKNLHLIFIGTKPDIIKQAPLYHALKRKGELVLICHTGQHYDYRNSKAVLAELDMRVDVNYQIKGTLTEKLGLIIEKTSKLLDELNLPGKRIIPYAHGDTLTALGVSLGAALSKIAPVHIEAGLRTYNLKPDIYNKQLDLLQIDKFKYSAYLQDLKNVNNYVFSPKEPFPEQIDTRIIDQIAGYCFAPNQICYQNLVRERNSAQNIYVVGNTINDAVNNALKVPFKNRELSRINLSNFIFFAVHRRENCQNLERLKIILGTISDLLRQGYNIIVILHPMFLHSVKTNIKKTYFKEIAKKYPRQLMLLKPISNHSDAIKVIQQVRLIVTDSGGIQEEVSILGKSCVILRFGSDRIEGVLSSANILAPPINQKFVTTIIQKTLDTPLSARAQLYGQNVSNQIVQDILSAIKKTSRLPKVEKDGASQND